MAPGNTVLTIEEGITTALTLLQEFDIEWFVNLHKYNITDLIAYPELIGIILHYITELISILVRMLIKTTLMINLTVSTKQQILSLEKIFVKLLN